MHTPKVPETQKVTKGDGGRSEKGGFSAYLAIKSDVTYFWSLLGEELYAKKLVEEGGLAYLVSKVMPFMDTP